MSGGFVWDLDRLFSEAQRVTHGVHFVPRAVGRKILQISTQTTAFRETNGGFAYEICLKTQIERQTISKIGLCGHTHTHTTTLAIQ